MAAKFGLNFPLGQSNIIGFTRFAQQDSVGSFGAPTPSGLVLEDTAANAWYIWVDTNGAPRVAPANTAEAAGFNWLTGGSKISAT